MAKSLRFGKGGCKRKLISAKNWLAQHVHVEHILLAVIFVASTVLLILILLGKVHLYGGDIQNFSNRLYLLSAIAQSLAAILSLVVSLTLIATQLAAQTYSPRVVNLRLRDPWLWGAAGLYIIAILWALESHGELALQWQKSADIAVLLAGAALFYLVPFTIATLHSLDPRHIARRLAKGSSAALDDMMRKAVNEPLMSLLNDGLDALRKQTIWDLERNSDARRERGEIVSEVGSRLLSIGRHACQMNNTDAFELAEHTLILLIEHCSEERWGKEANTLNGVLFELADYFRYTFWERIADRVRPDIARIAFEQAGHFYNIAQVQESSDAPAVDREANLHRAIDVYERALHFYTQARDPATFAKAKNKLANVYQGLSEIRDKEDNLTRAITTYTQALRVYTPDAFPVDYAGTMFNIGLLQLQAGDLPKAERSLQDAEEVFRNQGMIDWAERAHKKLELVREQTDREKE